MKRFLPIVVILFGVVLRWYAINWSLPQIFHPDETRLLYAVGDVSWTPRFQVTPETIARLSNKGLPASLIAVLLGVIQRRLTWRGFVASVVDTLRISCMVMVIIAGAMIFGRFLAVTRIPFDIATWVVSLPVPKTMILFIIFVIYILGGMVMDSLALLLITIPIFFPVANQLGYDPIWFGIIVTVITTLGAVTRPVAATAYVVGGMAKDVPLSEVFKGITYFLPAYVVCVILLMLFPQIITFLPNLIR